MEYHGRLFGKIGDRYFDTGRTSQEFDAMQNRIIKLEEQLEKVKNGNILESSESFLPFDCPHCGEHFTERLSTEGHRCLLRRNDTERT